MGFIRITLVVVATAVAIKILPGLMSNLPPLSFHGTTEKGWEQVAEVFKKGLGDSPNFGYTHAVYHEGKKVVDLYGGYADISTFEPYRENTLTTIFSSTKGLSALCVAMLADRGLLDYKQKVAHYWPEFGANGKESITVDTLLSHQAGLYTITEGWSLFDIIDNPEKISRQLAEQKPLWEPGTKQGYHALMISLYMNELIKRIDPKHRELHQFFKEEFVEPLDLDIHIGLPLSENYRVAKPGSTGLSTLEDWWALLFDKGWKKYIATLSPSSKWRKLQEDVKDPPGILRRANNPYVRQVPCGSFSGYGTARDLAKLMGILANGGTYDGKSYMSPKTVQLLTEALSEREDEVLYFSPPFGRGTAPFKSPLGSRMFGHPGLGGQMVYGDPEHKIGFAFLTNRLYSGANPYTPQFKSLLKATYDIVKELM